MITNGKKWHYLAVTNLSALLQGKSSNHKEDFYCLNCFNSYTTKNKLKEHEEICNNHDSCHTEMPRWVEKILKYNPGEKSLKTPFAIYLDLECLPKKGGAAHSNCNLNYKVLNDIPIIIHNASYDTHFIINQLAEEFKCKLNRIGENMEKYITFSVPIKKECDGNKIIT